MLCLLREYSKDFQKKQLKNKYPSFKGKALAA